MRRCSDERLAKHSNINGSFDANLHGTPLYSQNRHCDVMSNVQLLIYFLSKYEHDDSFSCYLESESLCN